ncbi:MAG: hypothetical protein WBG08_00170 [Litorimonas sp.]
MSGFASHVGLHAVQQMRRHLRNPFLWALALAGPVGARFIVPEAGAGYTLLSVNNSVLARSPSVIGLELGVIVACLFAPLAYIFLRAGPSRIQPRQVTDVAPRVRPALSLGRWIGDTAILWGLLLVLAVSGVVLSLFRLPLSDVSPVETLVPALFIGAPAMAVIACVRNMFAMRPGLRGAGGDVAFFLFWMVGITVSAAFFMDGTGSSPVVDMFGFAAPLSGGTSEPVTSVTIGGGPLTDGVLSFDGLSGVMQPDYILSRLIWLLIAGVLVAAAGFVFKPGKPKRVTRRQAAPTGAPTFSAEPVRPLSPKPSAFLGQLITNFRELTAPLWVGGLLAAIAVAGLFLPLRGMVGPALSLVLIFQLTRFGARWRDRSTVSWLQTLPVPMAAQLGGRILAAILLSLIVLLPSIVTLEAGQWGDVLAIGVCLPVIAVLLGHVTRGPVTARLLLLILWYGYLNV